MQKCTVFGNLRSINQERKKETRQMNPLFSSPFWALTVCDIYYCIGQNLFSCGHHFGPFWSAKYLIFVGEGCENRIWSHSIQETCTLRKVKNHIKESKKTCFTFFIELWSKFVWSHGLLIWIETYFLWGFWSRLFFSGKSFPQGYISHKWEW